MKEWMMQATFQSVTFVDICVNSFFLGTARLWNTFPADWFLWSQGVNQPWEMTYNVIFPIDLKFPNYKP